MECLSGGSEQKHEPVKQIPQDGTNAPNLRHVAKHRVVRQNSDGRVVNGQAAGVVAHSRF